MHDPSEIAAVIQAEPAWSVPVSPVTTSASDPSRVHGGDARDAQRAAWRALRARLPVPVTVGHNWTLVHTGAYRSGRNHIVVQADLKAGRLARRARDALCETPATRNHPPARNGTSRDPLRGVDRHDDGEDRTPTCCACLRIAERIAGQGRGR